ncbi:MAG: hypothetical protein AAGE52_10195 [Myxococcota bacterium]
MSRLPACLALLTVLAASASASAQFDTRFAFSLEGGGGFLQDAEESEDATVFIPGGAGSLMLGARVGSMDGVFAWALAYQGSVFADSSALLHRHHATVAIHARFVTAIIGGGVSLVTPLTGEGASDVGGSVTADLRVNFGRSGLFLGIPFKLDVLTKSGNVWFQSVLTLGFQTF